MVVDSDALIGLIHENDALHTRCLAVANYLSRNSFATIVPAPVILEAATTLAKDKTINRPDLAKKLLNDYSQTNIDIPNVEIFQQAASLYPSKGSKKNTPFDYLVLSTAKFYDIKTVFSFDGFYRRNGLTLIEKLLPRGASF